MLQDFELRLRTKLQPDSLEAILLKYLNSKDTIYSLKDMVVMPLLSYWLPLAYQFNNKLTQESIESKQIIRNCIYRLKLHQQYLQEMLGEELIISHQGHLSISVANDNLTDDSSQNQKSLTRELELVTENGSLLQPEPQKEEWFNPFNSL